MDEFLTRTYKRSQVEQAIGMLEFRLQGGRIDPALRSRLKRLLDADRGPASEDAEVREAKRFAFLQGKGPGQGKEIGYSSYEAFALLIGVRLLQGGITEGRTVALLQRTRQALEPAFWRIAAVPRRELQNDAKVTALEAEQRVRDGVIVDDPLRMTFFIELAGDNSPADLSIADDDGKVSSICDGKDLPKRLMYVSALGRVAVILELTNAVHQILYFLPHTTVRKRGRQ